MMTDDTEQDKKIREEAEDIVESISHDRVDEEVEDVVMRLEEFMEHNVQPSEARDAVVLNIAQDHGLDRSDLFEESEGSETSSQSGSPSVVNIGEIDEPDEWVSIEGEVVELWDPNHESIAQTGLIADKTGTVKFTSWQKSDLPDVEMGETYRFKTVVTGEYEGNYQINLGSQTEIEELETENLREEIQGMMIQVQDGSGLIMRDEEGRVVERSNQSEEYDLRLKTVVDDGETAYSQVIFDREATEKLTGMSLQEAKDIAKAQMDREIVAAQMKEEVLGKYYKLNCIVRGNVYLVDDYEIVDEDVDVDMNKLLSKVRGV